MLLTGPLPLDWTEEALCELEFVQPIQIVVPVGSMGVRTLGEKRLRSRRMTRRVGERTAAYGEAGAVPNSGGSARPIGVGAPPAL